MARTDDDSFSYAASSWISARISGTSDLLGKRLLVGRRSDRSHLDGGWPGGRGGGERASNLPASVANRIVGEEAIMSERVCVIYWGGGGFFFFLGISIEYS